MPHVAFILHRRTLLTGVAMPAEMFRAGDELWRVRERSAPRLRLTLTTTDDRPAAGFSAVTVTPQCRLRDLDRVDCLYLPPFWRRPAVDLPEALAALRRLAAEGALICAMSTGAYLVAEAGLLDGRAATTHWSFLDDFARRYPRVELKRQHLITRSGSFYCAGSVNAAADLTVHLIERFYDAAIARQVEAQFSPEIRRPAVQQGFFDDRPSAQPDELMAEAQPRVEEASALLRNTNLSIAEIAAEVGYEDAAHFATLFRRLTGRPPSRYRAAVRAKLFSVE